MVALPVPLSIALDLRLIQFGAGLLAAGDWSIAGNPSSPSPALVCNPDRMARAAP